MAVSIGSGPTLRRLRRPGWRDPRLLIGVALVLLSAVGGSLLVQHLSRTDTVLVATSALVPGDEIAAEDLQPAEVRLPDPDLYVSAPEHVPAGSVALNPVGAGEMIPRSSVAGPQQLAHRVVAVPVEGVVAAGVVTGAHIELWATAVPGPGAGDDEPTPALLVGDAVVHRVTSESSVGGARGPTIELVVPESVVPTVLSALAAEHRLDIVPLPDGSVR